MPDFPTFKQETIFQPVTQPSEQAGFEALGKGAKDIGKVAGTVERFDTGADVIKKSSDLFNEYNAKEATQENLDEFNQKYQDYASSTLGSTFPTNRPYIKNVLSANYTSYVNKLRTKQIALTQKQVQLGVDSTYHAHKKQMDQFAFDSGSVDSNDPKENPALGNAMGTRAIINDLINKSAATGLKTKQLEKYRNDASDSFHLSRVLGIYTHAHDLQLKDPVKYADAPQKIIDAMMKGKYPYFSPDKAIKIVSGDFKKIDAQYKLRSGIDASNFSHKKTNLFNQEIVGASHSPKLMGDLITSGKEHPEDIEGEANAYHDVGNKIQSAAGNVDELTALHAEFTTPLTKQEANNPYGYAISDAKKAGAAHVKSMLDQLDHNPANVTSTNDEVQHQVNNLTQSTKYVNAHPMEQPGMIADEKAKANLARQVQTGVPDDKRSALSDPDAAQLANQIKAVTDPDKQVQTMFDLVNEFSPPVRPYVMKSLKPYFPAASSYLLKANSSSDYRQYVPQMTIAYPKKDSDYKEFLSPLGLTMEKVRNTFALTDSAQQYTSYLTSKGGDVSTELNNFNTHGALLTAQLMLDKKATNVNDAAELAAKIQIGDASFHNDKESTYQAPPEIGFIQLSNAKQYMYDKAHKDDIAVPGKLAQSLPGLTKDQLHTFGQALLIHQSSFTNNSMNNGIIMLDHDRTKVKNSQGQTYDINFDDLKNPKSALNTEIDKFTTKRKAKLFATHDLAPKSKDLGKYLKDQSEAIYNGAQEVPLRLVVRNIVKKEGGAASIARKVLEPKSAFGLVGKAFDEITSGGDK